MAGWALAIAIGMSFTKPSDMKIDVPKTDTHVTFKDVRWAGQSFVSPLFYVVRIQKGNAALDFTHFKILAATQERLAETGTWHGQPVDDVVALGDRVQHIEVSHGVNSFGLVGIFRDPTKRGFYAGVGPVFFMPHAESTVDGKVESWGYQWGGVGAEAFAGSGMPAPWAELKHTEGRVAVGIADGFATIPISTYHIAVAP